MDNAKTEYARKRNFDITSEPRDDTDGLSGKKDAQKLFVVQKHHARNLHYDFRLELEGTLKSWAVPKGPSLDPQIKRLAVHVEDHPLSYAEFEGDIPKGQYGAGHVIIWDAGVWTPLTDPVEGYRKGKLKFSLAGEKLAGTWNLIRTRFKDAAKDHWLLIKEQDDDARNADEYDIVEQQPNSISARPKGTRHKQAIDARATPARAGPFPLSLKPQLATLADSTRIPSGHWLYEIKFDGYRILTCIHKGEVQLRTRNGHDWTSRMPALAQIIKALDLEDTWLDGEIVVLDKQGLPDFQALQNSLDAGTSDDIVYFLFDAPWLQGVDMRDRPLTERRQAVESLVNDSPSPMLRFSAAFTEHNYQSVYESACTMSLEGIIAKRANSVYRSRRTDDWLKLKCHLRQEFVIIGYTEPKGSRLGLGALLLGVYDKPGGTLLYCGRVGTGFSAAKLTELHQLLNRLAVKDSPLAHRPPSLTRATQVHWVKPIRVCEVEFSQWTQDHHVRHAVFIALRSDKPATDIIRENPDMEAINTKGQTAANAAANKNATKGARPTNEIAGVAISSPSRVIDRESGFQKIELASFYISIADWLLPHLRGRPVSLVRAPEGIDGEQFFQKHAQQMTLPHITLLSEDLDPGHAPLLEVTSREALAGAVQMGTVEFHTWGATKDKIERPDRITLDLDPDPALPWARMIEATQLVVALLDELGLDSYLKTSGGKGIHIIIPIARTLDWDAAKRFAKAVSQFMARQLPDNFADKMGPKNRINKIFIDYLRNSRGASTVTAYSVRSRPGLPISVPITRDELTELKSAAQWTVRNLHSRLQEMSHDPWHDYSNRQRITQEMFRRLDASAD